jgi:peptide-methionine (R)-S-oxide reductase
MLNLDKGLDRSPGGVDRRVFIAASVSALAGLALWCYQRPQEVEAGAAPARQPKMVQIVEFSDAGVRQGVVSVPTIIKSDEEWRKQLARSAFDITRKADTEMAFSGTYWNLHGKGLFRCICCDTALFSSETKFDSGTGWPSFWAPIAKENIQELADSSWGMERTAVSLPALRCSSGSPFQRRAEAHRASLLYEFGGFAVHQVGVNAISTTQRRPS